jgi:polyisoprenoid-binding protein YceI
MILAFLLLALLPFAARADAQPRPYRVVAGASHVAFEASYLLGDFSGTTEDVTADLRVDPDNLRLGVTGSVTVNPARLRTGIDGRDRDLRKTLEVDRYPEIRFTVGEVQASFPSLAERADVTLRISGVTLIRDVERAMSWSGRARIEDGKLWVRGEAELRLTDFGMTPPARFFLAVGDRVRVSFDLRLTPKE